MKTQIKFNENKYLGNLKTIEFGCEDLNKLKLQIETFTGMKINSKQAFKVQFNPIEIIKAHVNNITPETLQNANFEFKLEALGLANSYNEIVNYFNHHQNSWLFYEYEFEKGVFVFKGYEDLKEKHTIYAETETEKTKLDYFVKLKDLLNEGFENGLLNTNARPQIISTIKELNIDVPEDKTEFEVVINPYTIKDVV
jgi:hypothetical protein